MAAAPETGRAALEQLLRERYSEAPPTCVRWMGGRDLAPLDEVCIWRHPAGHWHYVTFGLSELGAKTSQDPSTSGWGFELTFRVQAAPGESAPPSWPVVVLQRLADYVYSSRNPFAENHNMALDAPLDDAAPEITGLAFTRDPELGDVSTANGKVTFLEAVPLREDEVALVTSWSVDSFVKAWAKRDPLLVHRPGRPSLLDDPEVGPLLELHAEIEGSSQTAAMADTLRWRESRWPRRKLELFVGPTELAQRNLRRMIEGRIDHGRSFRVLGEGRRWDVEPGTAASWHATEDALQLILSPGLATEMKAALDAQSLVLRSAELPGFSIHFVP